MPYHKAKMLYLSNLVTNSFRIAGALKSHFFGFSVLTINKYVETCDFLVDCTENI